MRSEKCRGAAELSSFERIFQHKSEDFVGQGSSLGIFESGGNASIPSEGRECPSSEI